MWRCYSMFESSWDLVLVTFRTPMVSSWKVTAWGYQSVFKLFRAPSFSFFLFNSWVVQNHMENCYRKLQRWPAPLCSGNWLFPVFILSSQSRRYHFQRCLAFSQRERLQAWDFLSVSNFISSLLLGFLFCLA